MRGKKEVLNDGSSVDAQMRSYAIGWTQIHMNEIWTSNRWKKASRIIVSYELVGERSWGARMDVGLM